MKKEEVRARITQTGIIAAIRLDSAEDAIFCAEAIYRGGVPAVEIAMTLEGATQVIEKLVKWNSDLIVGAGSVRNVTMARTCLDAGARFLTSDGLHPAILRFAARHHVVVIPGALTPTEVINAWELGCDLVKLAPCTDIGGANYVRSLHKMFPDIPLIAAGGIDQEAAEEYIVAGAVGLGVGGHMTPREAILRRESTRVEHLAHRFLNFVKSGRARLAARK